MKRLYFAHPINTYDTPLEEELLSVIRMIFPDWEIENPNQEKHQKGYTRRKEEDGDGMLYFTEEVLPSCSAAIFLAFRDGKVPAGVAKEVLYYLNRDMPVAQIFPEGTVIYSDHLSEDNILSVTETRVRLRDENGNLLSY